jgi:ATP-binding cassette subfamily B (MDR/TAP) protein 1
LLRQEVGFFDDEHNSVGALPSNVSSHPSVIAAASGLVLATILILSFNLLGSTALAFAMSWKLAVVCLAPICLLAEFGYANVVLLQKYESAGQRTQDESASYVSDNIGAIRKVQAMTREATVHQHYVGLLQPASEEDRQKYLHFGVLGFSLSQATVFWVAGLTF